MALAPGYYQVNALELVQRDQKERFCVPPVVFTQIEAPSQSRISGVIVLPLGGNWFQVIGGISFVRKITSRAVRGKYDETLIVQIIENKKEKENKNG